jgi:hypothetical protein
MNVAEDLVIVGTKAPQPQKHGETDVEGGKEYLTRAKFFF